MSNSKAFQSKWKFKELPKKYAQLVALYPPRPVRNEAQLEAATAIIDAMAGHELNADQDDYLDLVSTLVSDYEDQLESVSAKKVTPREALKYLLEESGMTASELGELLGNRELGSKILRGERELSAVQIATLAQHFAMSPELFMPVPRKTGARRAKGGLWRSGTRSRLS